MLALFSVPFMIGRLGLAAYGIYTLTAVVAGCFSVLDFQMTVGLTKYLAEYYDLDDRARAGGALGSGLIFSAVLGAVGAVGIALLAPFASSLFKVPAHLTQQTTVSFQITAATFLIGLVGNALVCVPEALRDYRTSSIVQVVYYTSWVVAMVGVLIAGGGLVEVVLASAVVSLFRAVWLAVIAWRALPPKAYPLRWSSAEAVKIANFSIANYPAVLKTLMSNMLDRLIIGARLGAAALPVYSVPNDAALRLSGLSVSMTRTMMPMASGMIATGDWERVRGAYLRATRIVLVVNTALVAMVLAIARPFLDVWMGPQFGARAWGVLVLATLATYLMEATNIPNHVIAAAGRPIVNGVAAGVQAGLNLILIFPFLALWGVTGAAVAFVVPAAIVTPVYLWYAHRKVIEIDNLEYLKTVSGPVLAGGAGVAGGLAIAGLMGGTVVSVLLSASTCLAIFGVLVLVLRGLDPSDLALLGRVIARILPRSLRSRRESTPGPRP